MSNTIFVFRYATNCMKYYIKFHEKIHNVKRNVWRKIYIFHTTILIYKTNVNSRKYHVIRKIPCVEDICLKYYRAPRYSMRCVIIVLVERRCTGCKNKWSSLLENNVYLQKLNGVIYARCLCTYRTVYALLVLGSCWRYEYKTMHALLVRELVWRMRIQNMTLKIHFLVPKCLCKQWKKMSSTSWVMYS